MDTFDTEVTDETNSRWSWRKASRKRTVLIMTAIALIVFAMLPLGAALRSPSADRTSPEGQLPQYDIAAPLGTATTGTAAYEGQFNSVEAAINGEADKAQPAQPWDRMIIRTGTLQLTVKDVGDSIQRVRAAATASGGYVFSSETRNEGEYTYATITVYVPSANFDQVMPELRALGGQVTRVANESISSSDVTEEFTDLDSQLRNLKATEGRMLALQAKAERTEDILAIDRELRSVQAEIERIQGRMTYLGKRAEMSTLTIYLSPAMAPAPVVEAKSSWQPLEAAEAAWNASLEVLGALATALISAAVFVWWLVPVLAIVVWVLYRARRRSTAPGGVEANAG
jgi:hypothetical protein